MYSSIRDAEEHDVSWRLHSLQKILGCWIVHFRYFFLFLGNRLVCLQATQVLAMHKSAQENIKINFV